MTATITASHQVHIQLSKLLPNVMILLNNASHTFSSILIEVFDLPKDSFILSAHEKEYGDWWHLNQ